MQQQPPRPDHAQLRSRLGMLHRPADQLTQQRQGAMQASNQPTAAAAAGGLAALIAAAACWCCAACCLRLCGMAACVATIRRKLQRCQLLL